VKVGHAATTIGAARPDFEPGGVMRATTRIARTQQILVFGSILLAACVSAGTQKLTTSPSAAVDREVVTEAEIADSHAITAYQAIERLRPRFLLTKVDLGPAMARQVYLNGIALGGVNELRTIPASSVREIRFVRSIDAPAFGTGGSGGVILVVSKSGR
jgi:hypothetical protein